GVAHGPGLDGGRLHQPAAEPEQAGDDGQHGDHRRRARHPGDQAAGAHGWRPQRSRVRSAATCSITAEKLTFSLTAIRVTTPASAPVRTAAEGSSASAVPARAPRALAPVSPSMVRSPRSSAQEAASTPQAPAATRPDGPGAASNGALSAPVTFSARPG